MSQVYNIIYTAKSHVNAKKIGIHILKYLPWTKKLNDFKFTEHAYPIAPVFNTLI